jgi:hypothetical protein
MKQEDGSIQVPAPHPFITLSPHHVLLAQKKRAADGEDVGSAQRSIAEALQGH